MKINSTQKIKIILVRDEEQFERYARGRSIEKIEEVSAKEYEKTIVAKPGYGYILYNSGTKETNISVTFDYYLNLLK